MQHLFCLLLTLSGFFSIHAQDSVYLFSYFKNNGEDGLHLAYSHDALRWTPLKNDSSLLTPAVGIDKLMRDPCIIRDADGKFHMVWTVSWREKGIGYANSSDLINWSTQQYIPVMEHEDSAMNCWAPEIYYYQEKKEYVIYWATTIAGRFPVSANAGDERYNHRMYYVTTKDFKKFSKTKLLYDQGFNVIDASIQKNGSVYFMFLKDETRHPPQKNIRIATSKHPYKNYSRPSSPITGDYWAEGPTVLKLKDQWIVYFDKYTLHTYGALSSTDLINWKEISNEVHLPAGARHGTVLTISGKEFWNLLENIK